MFATTEEFLRRFGVSSMVDLPTMNPEQEEEIIQEVEEELQMRLGAQEEEVSDPVSILRFACQNGGMQDDMTVLAAGIWKR